MRRKLAGIGVAGLIVVNTVDVIPPQVGVPLLLIAAFLAWRLVDGFWKTLGLGLAGGALGGLLILGPGYRLAMRVVAIMDPAKTPEFTVGGTLLIVVGIGGILGAINGAGGNMIRKVVPLSVPTAGVVLGLMVLGMLLQSSELRAELFHFGAGPWVNIPLFAVYSVGYGIAAMAIADVLDRRWARRPVTEREKVPA